jgi:murein DD-endopeptidase MepM/ murein hydrolase activator NlpD
MPRQSMNLRPLLLCLIGLSLCLPDTLVLAQGQVYRWVDADGNVHYGDRGAPDARKVAVPAPRADPTLMADLEVVRSGEGSDVYVSNRLGGPLEIRLAFTQAENVQSIPSLPLRQLLPARQRVLISRIASLSDRVSSYSVGLTSMPGDPRAMHSDVVYALPLDENSDWQIGQGFHGGFSHTDEQNLFALDLIVPEGTPILAARDGVVMQVESGFDRAGLSREKYAERANLVRILHDDGSMGIYAHLQENGVYVRVGQHVTVGQQIALSGNTGFTSGPHLHFCVQVNRGMRLVSVPFRMVSARGFLPLRQR